MHCHCGTNNRAPRWTFTDPCKPESNMTEMTWKGNGIILQQTQPKLTASNTFDRQFSENVQFHVTLIFHWQNAIDCVLRNNIIRRP